MAAQAHPVPSAWARDAGRGGIDPHVRVPPRFAPRRIDELTLARSQTVFNPPVEDGLAIMADRFLAPGVSEEEVQTMAVRNTRRVAGADSW